MQPAIPVALIVMTVVASSCLVAAGLGAAILQPAGADSEPRADNTPPIITLNGANPDYVPVGSGSYYYSEPGVTCTDETDPNPLLVSNRTGINLGSPGTYTVTYICTDFSDNESTATRTVIVEAADNTPPTITLNGANPETIPIGVNYVDPVYCTDDTDPAPSLVSDAAGFDVDFLGTYTITYTIIYTCTDSSGNESTATREVRVVDAGADPPEDNSPPNVNAGEDQTVGEGDTVTLSGSAADPDSGDSIESYSWSAPSGSGITLADGSSASTTFTAPAVDDTTTFIFRLTAGDGTDSGSDDIAVTVKDTGSAFITTWRTVSAGEAVTIPGTGTYSVIWGDGKFSDAESGSASHAYDTPGNHTVSITGGLEGIRLGDNATNAQRLQSIGQWGGMGWTTMESAFRGASNMGYDATDAPDLSGVDDTDSMFRGAAAFDGDLSGWDVSHVTDMGSMFYGASSFNGSISSWDVSQVTTMNNMFDSADSFQQNLGEWYVVPGNTSIARSDVPGVVGAISAQNLFLDGHFPNYGIGTGGDSELFTVTGTNQLNMTSVSAKLSYRVNVTAPGGDFGTGNHRILDIAVTDSLNSPPPVTNSPPTVSVGGDRTVSEGTPVSLSWSASDADADPLTYAWSQSPANPAITFASQGSSPTTFTAPQVDSDTRFTLTLTANDGTDDGADSLHLTVLDSAGAPPVTNSPPTVSVGGDRTASEGTPVSLSWSASDADADPLTYAWSQSPANPAITFASQGSSPTTFTAPQVDSDTRFTLTLTANDGTDDGADSLHLTVLDSAGAPPVTNSPPTVSVGGSGGGGGGGGGGGAPEEIITDVRIYSVS